MIEQIIIISLFCCGVFVTGEPDMIFHSVKERVRRWASYRDFETRVADGYGATQTFINHPISVERWWFKPIWGCVLCMASLWGTIGFALWNFGVLQVEPEWYLIPEWLLTVFCVCIMNGIIWNLYGLLGNLLEYWEERTK